MLVTSLGQQIDDQDQAEIHSALLINGRQVDVTLVTQTPGAMDCSGWRWGAEMACPDRYLKKIKLTIDGDGVFISRSAYADLGNIKATRIIQATQGFAVEIEGGDAASAYSAELVFSQDGFLFFRRIRSSEFPDDAWELTTYSYP
jgi:hypothetical protein